MHNGRQGKESKSAPISVPVNVPPKPRYSHASSAPQLRTPEHSDDSSNSSGYDDRNQRARARSVGFPREQNSFNSDEEIFEMDIATLPQSIAKTGASNSPTQAKRSVRFDSGEIQCTESNPLKEDGYKVYLPQGYVANSSYFVIIHPNKAVHISANHRKSPEIFETVEVEKIASCIGEFLKEHSVNFQPGLRIEFDLTLHENKYTCVQRELVTVLSPKLESPSAGSSARSRAGSTRIDELLDGTPPYLPTNMSRGTNLLPLESCGLKPKNPSLSHK